MEAESLLAEVRALREAVEEVRAHLGVRRRVVVRALERGALLGQPVTLEASVTRWSDAEPVVDAPVTFVATWGKLRTEGYQVQEGNTITLRTGLDGSARVVLLPPTTEDLSPVQQAVLEGALATLRPDVETPAEVQADLRELARQYRWEVNEALRQAVDIYFRDFYDAQDEPVNFRDDLATWPYAHTAVMAFAGDGEDPSEVTGSAVLPLHFRDWLAPWVQAYVDLVRSEGELRAELSLVARHATQAEGMLEEVSERVRRYAEKPSGRVERYVARKVAEEALHDLLRSGTESLPPEEEASLFSVLQTLPRSVARGELGVVSELVRTRRGLHRELGTGLGELREEGERVKGRLGELEGSVAEVGKRVDRKAGDAEISALRKELASDVDTRLANKAGEIHAGVAASLRGELVDPAVVTSLREELTTLRSTVAAKADAAALTQLSAGFNQNLNLVRRQVSGVQTQLQAKADRTELTRAVADKVSASDFTSFQTEVKTSLDAKVSTREFQALEGNVTQLKTSTQVTSPTITLRSGTLPTK